MYKCQRFLCWYNDDNCNDDGHDDDDTYNKDDDKDCRSRIHVYKKKSWKYKDVGKN